MATQASEPGNGPEPQPRERVKLRIVRAYSFVAHPTHEKSLDTSFYVTVVFLDSYAASKSPSVSSASGRPKGNTWSRFMLCTTRRESCSNPAWRRA